MATGSNCAVIFTEPARMSPHYEFFKNISTVSLLAIIVSTERATNDNNQCVPPCNNSVNRKSEMTTINVSLPPYRKSDKLMS